MSCAPRCVPMAMVEGERVYSSVHYVWIVTNVFHDVDLSVVGPVGLPIRILRGEHPNGRLRAAPGRQPRALQSGHTSNRLYH